LFAVRNHLGEQLISINPQTFTWYGKSSSNTPFWSWGHMDTQLHISLIYIAHKFPVYFLQKFETELRKYLK
jgi:hypothetical protein